MPSRPRFCMAPSTSKAKATNVIDMKKIIVPHAMRTNLIQHVVYFELIWIVRSKTIKFFLYIQINGLSLMTSFNIKGLPV